MGTDDVQLAADGGAVLGTDQPIAPDPKDGPGASDGPWTFRKLVHYYGGIFETYDAAIAGRIHPELLIDYLGIAELATYRQTRALERIAAALEARALPILSPEVAKAIIPDRPKPRGPAPVAEAPRCRECNGWDGKHSPNCPIGRAELLKAKAGG